MGRIVMLISPSITPPTRYVFQASSETKLQSPHPRRTPACSDILVLGQSKNATRKSITALIRMEKSIFI